MPIKTVSGPRCLKHQIECMYNCGWCSKPICDECVAAAHGKKYCDKCWTKKQQITPVAEPMKTSSAPRVAIKNVDTSLDPKIAEQRRAAQEQMKKRPFE